MNDGRLNGNWNGGQMVTNRGYRKGLTYNHPRGDRDGYVLEHILVAEAHLGRRLTAQEVVHHLNGDKLDNRVENLLVFASQADHIRYAHRKGRYVNCVTCGAPVWRRPAKVKRFNFCSPAHVNPNLWRLTK